MPTFKIVRRPKRSAGASGGERKRKSAAAVPDPVVSTAAAVPVPDSVVSAVPDPVVSSSAVALPAAASPDSSADGRNKRKRETNLVEPSSAVDAGFSEQQGGPKRTAVDHEAKTGKSGVDHQATSERDLPQGADEDALFDAAKEKASSVVSKSLPS